MSKKLFVGILFGGRSVEHEISIKSAKNVAANINRDKFEVCLIGIAKNGGWFLCPEVNKDIEQGNPVSLQLSAGDTHFYDEKSRSRLSIDIVFPVLHGTDGEDGSIQGLLKAAKIPFVGSGVLGSAASMDKVVSKQLLQAAGVPIGKFVAASYQEKDELSFDKIVAEIGCPMIIKPACLGSSVGVSKISDQASFNAAVENTFSYDNQVIFEEFIEARELECAIIGNRNPIASSPGEIVISKNYEFYTYEAKYLDPDAVKIVIPAEIDEQTKVAIQKASIDAYKALCCEDFSRVDLFLTADGAVLVNEINTIPGFTNSSMFPVLWGNEGISYPALITKLIDLALERTNATERLETNFSEGEAHA